MEVVVTTLEGCKRTIEITLPGDEPDKVYREMLEDFQHRLQVPGFRRGKVPMSIIEKRFSRELEHEVIDKLVPKAIDEAIEKEGLRPVEQPTLEDVQYRQGEPMKISASFEVRPVIALEKYTGFSLELKKDAYEVAEAEIEASLEQLRERAANFEPVEIARPVAEGDFATLDVRGEPKGEDGVPFRREDVLVEIAATGEDADFARNLVGASIGETKTFTVDYPTDFSDETIAGTSITYEVTVKEIKKRVLPNLDDDFAKDIGQFESLAQLREQIGHELKHEKEHQKRHDLEHLVIDAILEANPPFELPDVMVQRQLARRENELRRHMINRGVNPDHIGFDWAAFRESSLPTAKHNVQHILLLDEVATREKISVTAKEIREEIDAIAQSAGQDAATLRREMMSDGRFEAIGASLRDARAIDWLVAHNEIQEI
jgi:trigger factor